MARWIERMGELLAVFHTGWALGEGFGEGASGCSLLELRPSKNTVTPIVQRVYCTWVPRCILCNIRAALPLQWLEQ